MNSFISNDNPSLENDDNVRPPDQPVREQLISYNTGVSEIHEYPTETDIIQQSLREYEEQQTAMETVFMESETHLRKNQFVKTKPQLERLMKMDRENSVIYADLLTKIALYEEGWVPYISVHCVQYAQIHYMVQSIRIPEDERSRLYTLIRTEE